MVLVEELEPILIQSLVQVEDLEDAILAAEAAAEIGSFMGRCYEPPHPNFNMKGGENYGRPNTWNNN